MIVSGISYRLLSYFDLEPAVHADYKSMKPYIDITEDAKKDAIKLMEAAFRKK